MAINPRYLRETSNPNGILIQTKQAKHSQKSTNYKAKNNVKTFCSGNMKTQPREYILAKSLPQPARNSYDVRPAILVAFKAAINPVGRKCRQNLSLRKLPICSSPL
ncbi:hypothetical protein Dimus_014752 [Dionaea muscipula]